MRAAVMAAVDQRVVTARKCRSSFPRLAGSVASGRGTACPAAHHVRRVDARYATPSACFVALPCRQPLDSYTRQNGR